MSCSFMRYNDLSLCRKVFQESGTIEEGVWSVGTVMGLIDSVVSCQQLCDDIVR